MNQSNQPQPFQTNTGMQSLQYFQPFGAMPFGAFPAAGQITVSGTLTQGTQAGCVILIGDNGITYDLKGLTIQPQFGTRVTVTGIVRTDIASTCQQGVAFQVINITPATIPPAPSLVPSLAPPMFFPPISAPIFIPPFFVPRAPVFVSAPEFILRFIPPVFIPHIQHMVPFRVRIPFAPFLIIIRRHSDGRMEMTSDGEM